MQGLAFLGWSFASPTLVWYLMRRRIRAEQLRLVGDNDRLRTRNGEAAAELAESETRVEALKTNLADARSTLTQCNELRLEARTRAEVAEGIVHGQAKHIEALQRSNETMLSAITDMRRTGFSLPSDLLNAPDPEVITTVADDDLQAMKDYPHLVAADD